MKNAIMKEIIFYSNYMNNYIRITFYSYFLD